MGKKLIIITILAGLVSFSGTFVLGWLAKKPAAKPIGASDQTQTDGQEFDSESSQQGISAMDVSRSGIIVGGQKKKAMTEKKLKSLIYDVREKIGEYDNKLKNLEIREQRIQTAQETLRDDIEQLNNMRIELTSIVAELKNERDKLIQSRIDIAQSEEANLSSIAATYDKMDSASAGKILTNMTRMQIDGSVNLDDAVKILYYMSERKKAKLLAELVTSEPKLAAVLCQRLKKVVERD